MTNGPVLIDLEAQEAPDVAEAPPVPDLPGGDARRKMLNWRNLTFAPIDRRLILPGMLDADERAWLDAYHAEVLDVIGPRVSTGAAEWLRAACAPI